MWTAEICRNFKVFDVLSASLKKIEKFQDITGNLVKNEKRGPALDLCIILSKFLLSYSHNVRAFYSDW